MDSYSTSSSYELYSSPSPSESQEDLSSSEDLSTVEIERGRRVLRSASGSLQGVEHPAPYRKINNNSRSRSFSHFSLKRKFHAQRTLSEGRLVESPSRGEKFKERIGFFVTNTKQVFDRVISRLSSPELSEVDEASEHSDSDMERLELPRIVVTDAIRDSMSMDEEQLEKFRLGALEIGFPPHVQKLLLNFADESVVKSEACEKSGEIFRSKRRLKKEIKMCKQQIHAASDEKVIDIEQHRLKQAREELEHIKSMSGEPFSQFHGEEAQAEHLKLIENPQLSIDPIMSPGDILVVYQCVLSVKGSDQRFLFRKEGSIHPGELDLYILEAQSSLKRTSS